MTTTAHRLAHARRLFAAAVLAGVPVAAVAGDRAAVLGPPVPGDPAAAPVARGAIDDGPFDSTPVPRRGPTAGPRPAGNLGWLTDDPSAVQPAGATAANPLFGGHRSSVTNAGFTQPKPGDAPSRNWLKTVFSGDKDGKPAVTPASAATAPPAREAPTASSPVQGTTAAGAPVLAGPPAYRWYGYGTTTPGANQYAPTGQYPRASANWYGLTGATPGAFPVPVANGVPVGSGVEPPAYSPPAPPTRLTSGPAVPPPAQLAFAPTFPVTGPMTTTTPPARVPTMPTPVDRPFQAPPAMSVPTVPPRPVAQPVSFLPSGASGAPAASMPVFAPRPAEMPVPTRPVPTPPFAPNPLPQTGMTPVGPVRPPAVPVTARDDVRWQSAKDPLAGDGWVPGEVPVREPSRLTEADPEWRTPPAPVLVRGQAPDSKPEVDPVTAFIRRVIAGRADGVEVRWTAARRMTVCLEVGSETDGGRLVQEVSGRRELASYQIDFCVLVK